MPAVLSVLVSLVIALAGCSSEKADHSEGSGRQGPPAPRVKVAVLAKGSLDTRVRFLGNVQSALSTPIASAVAGTVQKVHVREGQAVARGALLAELDARRYRAELKAADALADKTRAQLEQAKRQLNRVKSSTAALSVPERERYATDVAVLEAQLAAEEATAERVRIDVARHRITAPFAGVVKARAFSPGAWVKSGDAVVELVSTEELEVLVDVPYTTGREIRAGDTARFLEGLQAADAIVSGVVPALDPNTRTMRVRLELAKKSDAATWLVPGMPIDVELELVVAGEGLLAPRDALIRGPVKSRVIRVDGSEATPVPVELLGTTADQVLILGEGLEAGDRVMTRGNERYRPGSPFVVED